MLRVSLLVGALLAAVVLVSPASAARTTSPFLPHLGAVTSPWLASAGRHHRGIVLRRIRGGWQR